MGFGFCLPTFRALLDGLVKHLDWWDLGLLPFLQLLLMDLVGFGICFPWRGRKGRSGGLRGGRGGELFADMIFALGIVGARFFFFPTCNGIHMSC